MIIGGVLSSLFWTIPLIAGVLLAFHIIPVPSGEVKYTALTIAYSFVFLILSLIVVCKGISLGKRYRYFKMYRSVLNDREFCSVKELAEKTRESEKSVCRNLRKMIKARMFWDGFLDEKGTCLIVSRTAYEQYQMALESGRQREEETVKMEAERASESPVEQMIRKGNEYIECIREANDAIPGEVISAKLDRLEMIIRKIFESVKQHPEQMNEMDKFMEYYLPTTQKLVNAYKEFDALPVKGENVTNSMNEIENTLDTISHAFEQLLDDLFQDAAFDISSDISVLQTMLVREGYKEKDFK